MRMMVIHIIIEKMRINDIQSEKKGSHCRWNNQENIVLPGPEKLLQAQVGYNKVRTLSLGRNRVFGPIVFRRLKRYFGTWRKIKIFCVKQKCGNEFGSKMQSSNTYLQNPEAFGALFGQIPRSWNFAIFPLKKNMILPPSRTPDLGPTDGKVFCFNFRVDTNKVHNLCDLLVLGLCIKNKLTPRKPVVSLTAPQFKRCLTNINT